MNERLPAKLEVTALCRRAESEGGFATVIRRGDPDRGTILLLVAERGQFVALMERQLGDDFTYRWTKTAENQEKADEKVKKRQRNDPDCWAIELDIADGQRFIAEMTDLG